MTALTPKQIRLILSCMGEGDSVIRPGEHTGLDRIELVQQLRDMAREDGEE